MTEKEKGYEIVTITLCGDVFVDAKVIYRWCHVCNKSTKMYSYQETERYDAHKCSECNNITKVSTTKLH